VSWSRRPIVTLVAILTLVAVSAGCSPPPPGPDVPTAPSTSALAPPAPTGGASPAVTSSADIGGPEPAGFGGDLRALVATAPAQAVPAPVAETDDGRADVNAMAKTYSYPTPEPYARRLDDLGFRQGAAFMWRLSQQNFVTVRLIQLQDERAARGWFSDRSQEWQSKPLDTTTFQTLNLPAEFDGGAHGTWFAGQAVQGEEGGSRTVAAVFYRHEIVVDLELALTDDGQLAPMADFARAQFSRLP
jgi:hypothetical protein